MKTLTSIFVIASLAICSTSAVSSEDNFYISNEMGGYHFGYNDGRIARQELRSPEGIVRGAYSYVDAEGQIQTVSYTADKHNGFLVSGSNVPRIGRIPEDGEFGEVVEQAPAAGVVQYTPEVLAARSQHFAALNGAPIVDKAIVPMPVAYTPEVAAARNAHISAYNKELLRNRGGVVYVSQPAIAPGMQYHPDYLPYVGL